MKYEATTSFAGEICMTKGETRELKSSLAKPLIDCGYLKQVKKETENEGKRNNKGSSA